MTRTRSTRSAMATRRGRRFDHNRIDLVPEKTTYKPGDTARIMIKSPWEQATALVTTEREGIRCAPPLRADVDAADDHRADHRGGHPERLRVGAAGEGPDEPRRRATHAVAEARRRRSGPEAMRTRDPGKPAFRLGYVELKVEDASKRLDRRRQGEQGGVPSRAQRATSKWT